MDKLKFEKLHDKVINNIDLINIGKNFKTGLQNHLSLIILSSERENLKNGINDFGIVESLVFLVDSLLQEQEKTELNTFIAIKSALTILTELDFVQYSLIENQLKFYDQFLTFYSKPILEKRLWIVKKMS